MQPVLVLELLILLAVANGTPVVAKRLFGGAFARPLDSGALFADGRPWFGPSKTIRGVVLATLANTAAAAALGLGWKAGSLGRQAEIGARAKQPGRRPRPDP
jgi:CDP-2,3-bis-(O-geranylgeranyl)-sn-glycerol synthase